MTATSAACAASSCNCATPTSPTSKPCPGSPRRRRWRSTSRPCCVAYPDRSPSLRQLFRQGLHGARLALEDAVFSGSTCPGAGASGASRRVWPPWPDRPLASRHEAREQALEVIRGAGRDGLSLRRSRGQRPGHGVRRRGLQRPGRPLGVPVAGQPGPGAGGGAASVGVGVEVGLDDGDRLYVTRVYPKGPAEDAGLEVGDRIVRIGGVATDYLPPDIAAERLRDDPRQQQRRVEIERSTRTTAPSASSAGRSTCPPSRCCAWRRWTTARRAGWRSASSASTTSRTRRSRR
ncbi:MAG: PDZ domain-containing protein [Gemmataceae bacterium]